MLTNHAIGIRTKPIALGFVIGKILRNSGRKPGNGMRGIVNDMQRQLVSA